MSYIEQCNDFSFNFYGLRSLLGECPSYQSLLHACIGDVNFLVKSLALKGG
jgi:hypothetical protein